MTEQLRNIFLIGRRRGDEDQLTEMLVWLASLVPGVGVAMARLAFGDVVPEVGPLEATTQQVIPAGRLDAVFTSGSLILVVESKLKSSYGVGQLRKYLDWLAAAPEVSTHRALMTLTERNAPWPVDVVERADELGVVAAVRRWEELFVALSLLIAGPDADERSARLVQEFLDMLTEEGLIPMKQFDGEELQDAWSRSEAVIRRYHDYFRACKDAVATSLEAKPHSNRSSAGAKYIYQDFVVSSPKELIGVGLNYSDRELPVSSTVYRNAPIVWLTIEAPAWPDWGAGIARLEAAPPAGWLVNKARWWGRPYVWRYLDDVVGEGTFEEQRARFAEACGQARGWLLAARPANFPPKPRRLGRR